MNSKILFFRSEWVGLVKQFGDFSVVAGVFQLFLPKWLSKMLNLSFFKLDPINRLGLMFLKTLKERKSTGIRFNDLSETFDDAIANGLQMDESTKIGNCLVAIFAGVETVSQSLSEMAQFLVENPSVQERLYAELKNEFSNGIITYEKLTQNAYLDAFVNESMRLGPPLYMLVKRAVKDTKVGEYDIPAGTEIALILYISQTSPDNWVNPKKFDPERFMDKSAENPNRIDSGTFLPFSQGKRHCIGKILASLEMKYLLTKMLLKYELKKPKDFKIVAQHFRGGAGLKNLPIIFEERQ